MESPVTPAVASFFKNKDLAMVTDDFTVVHPCAAGLDVHKMQITAAVRRQTTEGFKVEIGEFSALPGGLKQLCDWLLEQQVDAALMEATGVYWHAPFEALENAGIPAMLVHAQHVKQIKGRKTDVDDSRWLARVCQFGLAQPSMVPPREFRELRTVSRHRRGLVQRRSSVRNRVHKVIDRSGVRLGGILSDVFGVNGRIVLDGLADGRSSDRILGSLTGHVKRHERLLKDALTWLLSTHDRLLLRDLLDEHDRLDKRIAEFLRTVKNGLKPWQEQLELMQTIPGVDAAAACEIFVEMGPDLSVFGNVERLAAWAGVCPGNHESAGKRRSVRARRGSRHIAGILNQCAHAASKTKHCQFGGYHKGLTIRRGHNRATVATAHKLLRVIWAVLRDRKPYVDPNINYDELVVHRNAPRWIAQLLKFGYVSTTSYEDMQLVVTR